MDTGDGKLPPDKLTGTEDVLVIETLSPTGGYWGYGGTDTAGLYSLFWGSSLSAKISMVE